MNRKILSVLSVLIAVLMSTAALTGCSKAPAGEELSGGSGESMSAEQGGEPSASESGAESAESGAQSSEEAEEESFDYTGWQDFSEEIACWSPKISSHDEMFINSSNANYSGIVYFKLPPDFTIGYDVYGGEFHMSKRFDFYPSGVHVFEKSEEESMRELFLKLHPEAILFPELKLCICPNDFSEPWYDYPVVKEGRGDPDWMSAYGYSCYLQTDYGAFAFGVCEYAAFDTNYDMTEAIEFIKQLAGTISTSVVERNAEKP